MQEDVWSGSILCRFSLRRLAGEMYLLEGGIGMGGLIHA
jgi:hypothetical protein